MRLIFAIWDEKGVFQQAPLLPTVIFALGIAVRHNTAVKLLPKHELAVWIAGSIGAVVLFLLSHTFYVTAATYAFGVALVGLVGLLFWLRFRRAASPRPNWLRISSNAVLVVLTLIVFLYALGVATWYE